MTDTGKSPGAFRTIGEVAAELGLPQHVLRFWETRFPQVQPLKRGGNRRYYRPADVVLLRDIHRMLYDEGYTIKGVQKLLGDGLKPAPAPAPAAAPAIASIDLSAIRAIRDRLAAGLLAVAA
ncbi:MerR family transcriptional regulator [Glacieibacterium frigidum]|uniref:MerR family transcriptional regulator n=1 Tax=Glacieibacterium frigidum TaxID=2593303 RepID=A0A552UJ58_9SPHN|nr:MerR family transcriptional regulator [Glacieibacterium frigidum]TRW18215.1 MerR family transcriptional regulator [Glacieibacterium frigidum]